MWKVMAWASIRSSVRVIKEDNKMPCEMCTEREREEGINSLLLHPQHNEGLSIYTLTKPLSLSFDMCSYRFFSLPLLALQDPLLSASVTPLGEFSLSFSPPIIMTLYVQGSKSRREKDEKRGLYMHRSIFMPHPPE